MASYALVSPVNTHPLLIWFQSQKRDLPWRNTNDPYAIWVSEVMLQQTQVSTVIPYYLEWMQRFPNPTSLANALLEDVIKAWEGLGYYSRARNLHEGAKYFVKQYDGQIPNNEQDLQKIKGLGPYTIGAILSFAFHQKKCAIDGNVVRVLTRLFGITEDPKKTATQKRLHALNESLLPDDQPWIVMEALIELGALICQKKPRCHLCPLNKECHAFQNDLTDQIPYYLKRPKITDLKRAVALIISEDHILLKKETEGKIMSDLYEFPYIDLHTDENPQKSLEKALKKVFKLPVRFVNTLPQQSHHFTRFRAALFPFLFELQEMKSVSGYLWTSLNTLTNLPFSSGHRRILHSALKLH